MALDAKMIPFMQVDLSVSSQKARAEGTVGQYKESGTFCDRTAQNNSVLSPKPVHMAIKQ
jgi:hypothetical protein